MTTSEHDSVTNKSIPDTLVSIKNSSYYSGKFSQYYIHHDIA